MPIYDLILYDVWGNEKDGWDVNDGFRCGVSVTLPEDATDAQVIAAIYSEEERADVVVDPGESDIICMRAVHNGRPIGELRLRR
jgi:hypothetical protein